MNILEELTEQDRAWRDGIEARDRKWRKEDVEMARETLKTNVRRLYIASGIIGFLGVLAVVALGRLLK